MKKSHVATVISMIVIAGIMRCVPHLPNFAPTVALALFGAVHLKNRWAALGIVWASMLIGDVFLGFHAAMWATYLGLGLIVLGGSLSSVPTKTSAIFGMTLASSTVFFLVSNFGVWVSAGLYPHSFGGLVWCYTMAIPFFGYAVLGDLFYAGLMFGVYMLLERRVLAVQTA